MRRLALLCAMLLSLLQPAPAPPTLAIWTANDHGVADLMPGGRVIVVIELRSVDAVPRASLQHLTPAGLVLESATASSGAAVTTPFASWAGAVSSTQPINVVLHYRVRADAEPGGRELRAQAQVGGVLLKARAAIRVCCGVAPPKVWRVYFPASRAGRLGVLYFPVWRG